MNEGILLANMATNFYKKPELLGGGGNSFEGWKIPKEMQVTASGSFISEVADQKVIITATGNEVVTGTDSVKIQISVSPDAIISKIIN